MTFQVFVGGNANRTPLLKDGPDVFRSHRCKVQSQECRSSDRDRVHSPAVHSGLPSPNLRGARPANPTPSDFSLSTEAKEEGAIIEESSGQIELHEFFNDPMLTSLMDQAFIDNQELKILAEDIQIARNEVYKRRGAYLPFGFLGARAGFDKPGAYTRDGAVEENLTARGRSFPAPLPEFLVAANVSWEIDIWKDCGMLRMPPIFSTLARQKVETTSRLA